MTMLAGTNFRAERCVRYHYAYSACSRCADACPHQAVRMFDAGVELLADKCQSCALCVAACPTEALTENSVSAESLLKFVGKDKRLTIACAPSGSAGDAVVPCLGAINAVVLAEMAGRGIALQLGGSGHCSQCVHAASGPDLLQTNLAARAILCGVDRGGENKEWAELSLPLAQAQKTAPADEIAASRRQLFRRVIGQGADVLSGAAEVPPPPLKAIRATAPFLPERKELLNGLYGDAVKQVSRHPAIPAEDWIVAAGCTNCEACARVCPTGAMQLLEDGKSWRLVFLNERCVACDACVEVCQPKVLRQHDEHTVYAGKLKARLLRSVARKRCTSCDRLFSTEGDGLVCPTCITDDEDFSHIFG